MLMQVDGVRTISGFDDSADVLCTSLNGRDEFIALAEFAANPAISLMRVSSNFKMWYLDLVERDVPEMMYEVIDLENVLDRHVLLHFNQKLVPPGAYLAHILELIERQKDGQSGILRTDGGVNAFYRHDCHGKLRSIGVRWCDEWEIFANDIDMKWRRQNRFFFLQSNMASV